MSLNMIFIYLFIFGGVALFASLLGTCLSKQYYWWTTLIGIILFIFLVISNYLPPIL